MRPMVWAWRQSPVILAIPWITQFAKRARNGCLYQTDGTTDDFAYGALGVPSFTIEFGNSFFQACSTFEDSMVQPSWMPFFMPSKPRPGLSSFGARCC